MTTILNNSELHTIITPSPATIAPTSSIPWQQPYANLLIQNNTSLTTNFQWINQYEALYQAHTHILQENKELKQQLTTAREEIQVYRQQQNSSNTGVQSISNSSTNTTSTIVNNNNNNTTINTANTAEITRLQSKLLELQDQLTGFYRKESETIRERLSISENNQRLKDTLTTLQNEIIQQKEQYQHIQELYEQTKAALAVRDGQLSVTTEELTRLRIMFDNKSKESDIINNQMEGIASRIATEKERSATEINNLNTTVTNLRKDRAQLELLVENLNNKLKEKDIDNETLKLTIQILKNSNNNNNSNTGLSSTNTTTTTSSSNPLLSSNVPVPLQELSNRASSLFGQVSAFVTNTTAAINTGGSKSVIMNNSNTNSLLSSATTSNTNPTKDNTTNNNAAIMVDSLSTSVSGLVRDYVFASVPLPTRVHCTIQAHKSDINTVKFTTDNKLIATGSNDGTVALFDVNTSRNCALLLTNTHNNNILCLDTYGPMITVGCSDRSIRIFDLHTQRVLRSLTGHNGKVQSILYVPPAGGLKSGVDLSNLTSPIGSSSNSSAATTTFSRGMIISGGTDKTVKIWDYKDGRCTRSIDTRSIVNSIAISPDGVNIVVGNQDGGLRLFDIRNGAKIAEVSSAHSAAITSVTFNRADGGMTILTAGRDNTLRLFDSRTLESLGPLVSKESLSKSSITSDDTNYGSVSPSHAASLYATGTRLRATSNTNLSPNNNNNNNNTVSSFSSFSSFSNVSSSTSIINPIIMKHSQFNLVTNLSTALLSPNGQYALAGSSDSSIYIWSTAKGEFELELGSNKHQLSSTKITKKISKRSTNNNNNDDHLFGGAFAELENDNLSMTNTNINVDYDTTPHHGAGVISMDWSTDGQYLASGDTQGNLVLWTQ